MATATATTRATAREKHAPTRRRAKVKRQRGLVSFVKKHDELLQGVAFILVCFSYYIPALLIYFGVIHV